jgi:zinc transport system substrate-binding protein
LLVFVSIVPQKTFVQQIGKDRVDVKVMVPPGASPHTFEPKPRQMVSISRAKIFFAIGVAFEKAWLNKIAATNPKMKVVRTDHGIEKLPMAVHQQPGVEKLHDAAAEGPSRAASHHPVQGQSSNPGESIEDHHRERGGLDPHIWLSPPLVKQQARTILRALQEIDPAYRDNYEANYRRFVSRIDILDAQLRSLFAGKQGLQFMVFHPAWGYFARAYGLKQVPVEIEGKSPKPAQLKQHIEHAKKNGIKVIFAQPQFSAKSAALVAREIGGEVVLADPLEEDWLANMRAVAEQFKSALR